MIIKGYRRINEFLAAPRVMALLLHGSDMGLAASYARRFADKKGKPLAIDPQAADLSRALLCVDMFNPPSAVFLRDASKLADGVIESLITDKPLEVRLAVIGGSLTPSNKLRRFFEGSPKYAAIGCYPLEGEDLRLALEEFVTAGGSNIDAEAIAFLASSLPGEWGIVEAELDKLLTYGEKITLDVARQCLGSERTPVLNEFNDALGDGDKKLALRLLNKLLAETELVRVVRSAGVHFTAIARAGLMERSGTPLKSALMGLEPPIFFPRQNAFIRQMRRLPPALAAERASELLEAEILAKSGKLNARSRVLNALLKAAD